ncbi:amino acid transporter, partial [Gymnopus androsaceus JB14]
VAYGLVAPLQTSLLSGGPATILWRLVLFANFLLPLSLGEISSQYPSSSGTYLWTYMLAPHQYRLLLSWITGWLVTVGYWVVTLSVTFGISQLILAGVNIFSQWEATPWQNYLIFVLVVVLITSIAIVFDHVLPSLDVVAAVWNFLGTIVIVVCLSVKAAQGRHSVTYALTNFSSQSGWTPGWAFFIGLYPVPYTFLGVPCIATMAEEVHEPSVNIPRAMIWSVPTGCLLGVVYLLPILFTLPDISALLAAPDGQPTALLFQLIMGSKAGGFGLWIIVFGVAILCSLSITCATSRATWALARDRAVPFHHVFSRLGHARLSDTPVNAYILSALVQLALGCTYLGSTAAFNSFIAVSVMCFNASFVIPILLLLLEGRHSMKGAPFSLGLWGYPLNTIAVLWAVFEIIIMAMPVSVPVQQSDMNYASVIFLGFAVVSAIWYIIGGCSITELEVPLLILAALIDGRRKYAGPLTSDEPSNVGSE